MCVCVCGMQWGRTSILQWQETPCILNYSHTFSITLTGSQASKQAGRQAGTVQPLPKVLSIGWMTRTGPPLWVNLVIHHYYYHYYGYQWFSSSLPLYYTRSFASFGVAGLLSVTVQWRKLVVWSINPPPCLTQSYFTLLHPPLPHSLIRWTCNISPITIYTAKNSVECVECILLVIFSTIISCVCGMLEYVMKWMWSSCCNKENVFRGDIYDGILYCVKYKLTCKLSSSSYVTTKYKNRIFQHHTTTTTSFFLSLSLCRSWGQHLKMRARKWNKVVSCWPWLYLLARTTSTRVTMFLPSPGMVYITCICFYLGGWGLNAKN